MHTVRSKVTWGVKKTQRLGLTAPNATDSMVCMRASSMELSTPFLLSRARPASVQNRTCWMPTDTKCVSESGRNSATKILWVWPMRLATLAPLEQKKPKKKKNHDIRTLKWGLGSTPVWAQSVFLPSCHFQMVTLCSGSRPTDSRSFPVALKLTEHTPPEWKQRSTDRVCLVMASHTWMDGDVAEDRENAVTWLCVGSRIRI